MTHNDDVMAMRVTVCLRHIVIFVIFVILNPFISHINFRIFRKKMLTALHVVRTRLWFRSFMRHVRGLLTMDGFCSVCRHR